MVNSFSQERERVEGKERKADKNSTKYAYSVHLLYKNLYTSAFQCNFIIGYFYRASYFLVVEILGACLNFLSAKKFQTNNELKLNVCIVVILNRNTIEGCIWVWFQK